ncbi:MAG: DNA-binding protein [Alphaproteobacteria bacterium]|nr:DNA-binding protein [Alphaproteobacteria bacterium]MCB9794556.1 DNA-binding protein [Alphaproteobacteria bacterium]
MAQLTIRKLDEALVRALKVRAAERGRSAEAEVRAILQEALAPRSGQRTFAEHLLAMPVDPVDEDPFPRIQGDVRDVEL